MDKIKSALTKNIKLVVLITAVFFFAVHFQNCDIIRMNIGVVEIPSGTQPFTPIPVDDEIAPPPVLEDLNPDLVFMIDHLQVLAEGWDQDQVDQVNSYLMSDSYDYNDWVLFFDYYFSKHKHTSSLWFYLSHPAIYWGSSTVKMNLQKAFVTVATRWLLRAFQKDAVGEPLSMALQQSRELRFSYQSHFKMVAVILRRDVLPEQSRQFVYDFFKERIEEYPGLLRRNAKIDIEEMPYIASLRAMFYSLMRGTSVYESESFIADTGFSGVYADLVRDFDMLVLDNLGFTSDQLAVIRSLLEGIPRELYLTGHIMQNDHLGNKHLVLDSEGVEKLGSWLSFSGSVGVNTFRSPLSSMENGFPSDMEPYYSALFANALQHEANHIVDAFYVSLHEELKARRAQLISQAGETQMQYLRSMIASGYFVSAPQEFFASISNQYFAHSFKTLELGLLRFDNGYKEPINQFLFFADVYSQFGDTTQFYTWDSDSYYINEQAPVTRDENGHINSVEYAGVLYSFELDVEGNVLSYNISQ